jgi:hypothetical protein
MFGRISLPVLAITALVALLTQHASAVMVNNNSFEMPTGPTASSNVSGSTALTGWTSVVPSTSGDGGGYFGNQPYAVSNFDAIQDAQAGSYWGLTNDPGTGLYQDLGPIQLNTTYQVTVDIGSQSNYPSLGTVELLNGTNNTGTLLGSVTSTVTGSMDTYQFTAQTGAVSGDLTIYLYNSTPTENGNAGIQTGFDDVQVSTVPEPSTLCPILLAVTGLLGRRRGQSTAL